MADTQKKLKKQKRKRAAAEQLDTGDQVEDVALPLGKGAPKKKMNKKRETKDPDAAAEYLQLFSLKEAGDSKGAMWRFNKATQSWLLRHMYIKEKVVKKTFSLLLQYLDGLKGLARDRVLSQAEEIIKTNGALTQSEDEINQSTSKNTEANAKPSSSDALRDNTKLAEFRVLRAKKVLLQLSKDSDSDSDE